MLEDVKTRLHSLGYTLKDGDEALLSFSIQKAENTVKNECNITAVPSELLCTAVDIAVGEFLQAKKTFAPQDITSLDLDFAVKQIQTGNTSTTFAVGEGNLTSEQRLDNLISFLINSKRGELLCFRRIRW